MTHLVKCAVCSASAQLKLAKIGKVNKTNIILKLSVANNADDAECDYKL